MLSINNYLRDLASELFISYGSKERERIDKSIDTIMDRLESFFDDELDEIAIFGSYDRGTILPNKYDKRSDIDLLVNFNIKEYPEKAASTYRDKLRRFAQEKYSTSISKKDFPSVVIELRTIKFDLVPAIIKKQYLLGSEKIWIPDSKYEWQKTYPFDFSEELTQRNTKYNSIVKPIIRLLKFWNAKASYPFPSFELEQLIADMNFRNKDIQDGFFYVIEQLGYPGNSKDNKIESLKNNAEKVQNYLEDENFERAMNWLHRILPD